MNLHETEETKRPHISFSQVSMYIRCSLQYYYRYVLGWKEKPKLAMSVGRGGHSALEYNGKFKMRTGEDLATSNLLDLASTFIDAETTELEQSESSGMGEAKDRAIAALRVFRERDAPSITPIGVEVEFNLDLNEPNEEPIRIVNGKIDLITAETAVEDYKFVKQARSQTEVDISPQLTLYGKVFHKLTGRYPSKTGYRMFLGGSTRTAPETRAVYRDASLMTPERQQRRFERLAFQFRAVERGITAGLFIPTDDPRVCGYCGYRERCQASLVDDFEAAKIRGEI